jgi:hypothetical protein
VLGLTAVGAAVLLLALPEPAGHLVVAAAVIAGGLLDEWRSLSASVVAVALALAAVAVGTGVWQAAGSRQGTRWS